MCECISVIVHRVKDYPYDWSLTHMYTNKSLYVTRCTEDVKTVLTITTNFSVYRLFSSVVFLIITILTSGVRIRINIDEPPYVFGTSLPTIRRGRGSRPTHNLPQPSFYVLKNSLSCPPFPHSNVLFFPGWVFGLRDGDCPTQGGTFVGVRKVN